jgi:hypothetical protein
MRRSSVLRWQGWLLGFGGRHHLLRVAVLAADEASKITSMLSAAPSRLMLRAFEFLSRGEKKRSCAAHKIQIDAALHKIPHSHCGRFGAPKSLRGSCGARPAGGPYWAEARPFDSAYRYFDVSGSLPNAPRGLLKSMPALVTLLGVSRRPDKLGKRRCDQSREFAPVDPPTTANRLRPRQQVGSQCAVVVPDPDDVTMAFSASLCLALRGLTRPPSPLAPTGECVR